MSLHKIHANREDLNEALKLHRLPHDKPSQLADAFRSGWLFRERNAQNATATWRVGFKFQLGGLWFGAHYSSYNKRICINLIPCLTVWVCLPGGKMP